MNASTYENHPFDTISVGQRASLTETLSKEEIQLFAAASGDYNPTHLNDELAMRLTHGKLAAHSMWGAALLSRLLSTDLPGPGTIYKSQGLRFLNPVRVGDTLNVVITVRTLHPDEHTVVFDCAATNQDGVMVFSGLAEVIAPTEKLVLPRPEHARLSMQSHNKYEAFLQACQALPRVRTAVAHPCDAASLVAVVDAWEARLIDPVLVGPADKIRAVALAENIDLSAFELIDVPHSHAAAATAVELVRLGKAEALMKGSLHTDELMHEVANPVTGLRTARRISHVFLMDVPTYHKPLLITDAAINIAPGLDDLRDICQNAIELAHMLKIDRPKVAILSAVETINEKIASTLNAAALCKMADRGQITGALLDGPLALDNAISREAAQIKGIVSEVAGDADILLVPDLVSGNILAKQLSFMANADAAGMVLGARVPIILTSRADNLRTRLASCAVAVLIAQNQRMHS